MDELDEQFRSYCAHGMKWVYHPELPNTPWNFKVEANPTFAVIVGETVQNIRSALDYLIYELVRHTRGRKPRLQTQFPLYVAAGDFYGRRYQIKELPGELRRRIRKLQPYQFPDPGTHPLAVLNKLSNADKHRLLLATTTRLGDISMVIERSEEDHGRRRGPELPFRST